MYLIITERALHSIVAKLFNQYVNVNAPFCI